MRMLLRSKPALDAVKGRWERVFCLGDIVDYGPDPNEVTERVKELAPVIIRGNHDKAVAGLTDLEDFNPMAQIAALWTRQQMSPETLKYVARIASRASFRGWHHAGSRRVRGRG